MDASSQKMVASTAQVVAGIESQAVAETDASTTETTQPQSPEGEVESPEGVDTVAGWFEHLGMRPLQKWFPQMPAQTVAADVPIAEPPESAQVLEVVAETIVEGGSEHCGKTGDGSGSGAADATSGGLPESPEVLEEVAEKRSPTVAEIANSQSMTKTKKKDKRFLGKTEETTSSRPSTNAS